MFNFPVPDGPELAGEFMPLVSHLEQLSGTVAIDGPSGSGKSTLAAQLCERLDAALIRMDDFFPRPHQRTPERLAKPGGNLDCERFYAEVIASLRSGGAFDYQRYDCERQKLGDMVHVPAKKLRIVEGVYSCHPIFAGFYDCKVFLTVDDRTRHTRLLRRGGQLYLRFTQEWIPMEDAYFKAYGIRESCDFIFAQG